ncbi:MAG TPA: 16S rRNA (cytosine(1402)-N(4))-methyltransferase, partial [Pseudonocardiaceae bacterium]
MVDDPVGAARSPRHSPVLLRRCLELLEPALAGRPAVVLDATVGLGGHAAALLDTHPALTLVGLDRDPQALALAGDRLRAHSGRTHLVHAVYDELPDVLDRLGIRRLDGALFDLGVSSLQLDAAERGFSYARDTPLDMRMDPSV